MDGARLGVLSPPANTTSGTLCFDAFESRRASYIGLLAGVQDCGMGQGYSAMQEEGGETLEITSTLVVEDMIVALTATLPLTWELWLSGTETVELTGTVEVTVTEVLSPTLPLGEAVSAEAALAALLEALPSAPQGVEDQEDGSLTIEYEYDPLNRLTVASYSDGRYFEYSYDSVGNRLSEETESGTVDYIYDTANRLVSVDSVSYTWDNNGNLLDDGVNTYTYDQANRLHSVSSAQYELENEYNGLGDRLSQTVDEQTTFYTLDLASGLTQVLSDGTRTYLYGVGRMAQQGTEMAYFLADALGSVRQLADESGNLTLARGYKPYGEVLESAGAASSAYGFTGEWTDNSGLVYLRARYYDPRQGRFMTRDTWLGNKMLPISYNAWLYGYANPNRWTDKTGLSPRVNCEDMPSYLNLRTLCEIGNGDDNDPTVLDAREKIFRTMVKGGYWYGVFDEGYHWAAAMLEHFLDGNGAYKAIEFSIYNDFPYDSGITRTTKEERSPAIPSDEPSYIRPLLYEFVYTYIQSAAGSASIFDVGPISFRGQDFYQPKGTQPRPYNTGFWAAFGHVTINGQFTADVRHSCTYGGYYAEYTAHYRIDDSYAWGGKSTPFMFPFASNKVWIPHEWELSLVNANPPRAYEYDFSISWTETEWIFVFDDFSFFRELDWTEWEGQYGSP